MKMREANVIMIGLGSMNQTILGYLYRMKKQNSK